ncbi:hypothetical protein CYMTET_36465, partial [Cymbomonas tetramitiformis]
MAAGVAILYSDACVWKQKYIGQAEVRINHTIDAGLLQLWYDLYNSSGQVCGQVLLRLVYALDAPGIGASKEPKRTNDAEKVVDSSVMTSGAGDVAMVLLYQDGHNRYLDAHFITRLLQVLEQSSKDSSSGCIRLEELRGKASWAISGATDREIEHLLGMVGAGVEASGGEALLERVVGSEADLLTELRQCRKIRAAYWGARVDLTHELPPLGQSVDPNTAGPLGMAMASAMWQLAEIIEAKHGELGERAGELELDAEGRMGQLGVLRLVQAVLPELSVNEIRFVLVHVDEMIGEDGRADVNELYTAARWWMHAVGLPSSSGADLRLPLGGSGHVLTQLLQVLEDAAMAECIARVDADGDGRLEMQEVGELMYATCSCSRERDSGYLQALLEACRSSPTLDHKELAAHVTFAGKQQKLYWKTRCSFSGETPPVGQVMATGDGEEARDEVVAALGRVGAALRSAHPELQSQWAAFEPDPRGRLHA